MAERKIWEQGQKVKRNLMRRDQEYTVFLSDGSQFCGEFMGKGGTTGPRPFVMFYRTFPSQGISLLNFADIDAIYGGGAR